MGTPNAVGSPRTSTPLSRTCYISGFRLCSSVDMSTCICLDDKSLRVRNHLDLVVPDFTSKLLNPNSL